jgi:hypothetical protein
LLEDNRLISISMGNSKDPWFLGYKMKKIAFAEGITQGALSGRQIKTSVIKLINKKLLTSVTYFNREKYYSTVIKCPEKLRELIKNKKLHNHQVSCGIEDFKWSLKTKEEMALMRRLEGAGILPST